MNTVAIVLENDWYDMEHSQTTNLDGVFVDEKAAFDYVYSKLITRAGDKEAKEARIAFRKGTREFRYYTWGSYEIITKTVQS